MLHLRLQFLRKYAIIFVVTCTERDKRMFFSHLEKTNPDIADRIQKNDKKIRIRFALWTILLVTFYLFVVFTPVLERKGLFWALILLPVIPCAVFVFVGGLRLFDPAFEGEVTKVVFSVRLDVAGNPRGLSATRNGRVGASGSARQVNYTKFFVTDQNGKQHRYAVQLPNNRIDLGIKVGDTIRKYHGLPYPILLNDPVSICPVCGSVNHKNDPHCYDCGYSILKNP